MEVFHLGNARFAEQLTGEGAKLFGGRWNHVGIPCIYTSANQSLCVLEYAVNVSLELLPANLAFTTYFIPDGSWKEFRPDDLPKNWDTSPAPQAVKDFGSAHLKENKFLALKVPSSVIPAEFNYILNPLHPEFRKVKIKNVAPFTFDSRIKK